MIRQLLPFAKKYRLYAILAPLSIAGEVAIEVRIPFLLSSIINDGILKSDFDYVVTLGLKMVLLAMLSLLCGALAARFAAVAGMGFGTECRNALFNKVQDFAFSNIDKFTTGSLVTRMTTDTRMLQNAFMMIVRICVRAPLMFVMAIVYALHINTTLSLVFLAVAPPLAAALILIGKRAHPRFTSMFQKFDCFNTAIQENLIAIRVVKAFVRARHEKEKFEVTNDELRDTSIFAEKLVILNGPLMSVAMYVCVITILFFGSRLIIGGTMQLGDLSAIISYVSQILMSLMMLSMIFVMAVMAKASLTRVCEVLCEMPAVTDENADPALTVADGSIEMRNVCFKYSASAQKNVLENINLKIAPGETVGILGMTGSAKSTLVQLIPRLYDATAGEILVSGRNVREYTLDSLRGSVSMVLQNDILFSGTIKNNLLWGDGNATDEKIAAACEVAQANAFIDAFPDSYETTLGQDGAGVSGGQKQRLTIARALLKKPKILILDDSTSAVDTATDKKIREALGELTDTTKLIIAQRIASVIEADRIIVLDEGKISAVGTHDELMKNSDIYREVYESQQEGGKEHGAA